ncbi:MAG: M48 family metalloprotease [Pseudomonadota bacterium]
MLRANLSIFPAVLLMAFASACVSTSTTFPTAKSEDVETQTTIVQAEVIAAALDRKARIDSLAWPLLEANAELCHARRRTAYGISFGNEKTIQTLVDGLTLEQIRAAGYDASLKVISVSEGSPAADAGLKPGAVPIKIGETAIGSGGDGLETALRKDKNARAIAEKADLTAKPLPMVFEQDGTRFEIELHPETICDVALRVTETDAVNASAGRRVININRGIITYLEDDQDLSMVIAHELAHVAGEHTRKLTRNHFASGRFVWAVPVWLGAGLVDLGFAGVLERFAGRETPPGQDFVTRLDNRALGLRDFEREADYLAVYFVARAGLELEGIETVFERLSLLSPRSTYGQRTHPVTPERVLALRLARAEVDAKRAAGDSLVPEGWPFPLGEE